MCANDAIPYRKRFCGTHCVAQWIGIVAIATAYCASAFAQSEGGDADGFRAPSRTSTSTSSGASSSNGSTTVIVNPTATTSTTTTVTPWGAIGGGSAEPGEGGSYGFDLPGGAGRTDTVRGNVQGSFVLSNRRAGIPLFHIVRSGETLWDLCERYYDNPYAWPKVWSLNPQIENPHWIYPGDRLRMRGGGLADDAVDQSSRFVRQQSFVPSDTVFLRNYGFVGDGSDGVFGMLVGSPDDQMLLSEGNEAYVRIDGDRDVRVGQELALVKSTRKPEASESNGLIVQIKGTVKVAQWDKKTKIARVRIVESLDVIERGDKVASVTRSFDVVPPVRNDREVWAKITGAIQPSELIGQHHVVFIDKGENDGLRPGNRLFVLIRGDRWNESVKYGRKSAASTVRYELHSADVQPAPDTLTGQKLPSEVVGEVRVLRTKKQTSICVVTFTRFELEPGQVLLARRGY